MGEESDLRSPLTVMVGLFGWMMVQGHIGALTKSYRRNGLSTRLLTDGLSGWAYVNQID